MVTLSSCGWFYCLQLSRTLHNNNCGHSMVKVQDFLTSLVYLITLSSIRCISLVKPLAFTSASTLSVRLEEV